MQIIVGSVISRGRPRLRPWRLHSTSGSAKCVQIYGTSASAGKSICNAVGSKGTRDRPCICKPAHFCPVSTDHRDAAPTALRREGLRQEATTLSTAARLPAGLSRAFIGWVGFRLAAMAVRTAGGRTMALQHLRRVPKPRRGRGVPAPPQQ
jgi:hypothetical protein